MATPSQLREGVETLTAAAEADLDRVWAEVDAPEEARAALIVVLPVLVETYGEAAATLAADWYDETRAQAGIAGRFTAAPAPPTPAGTDELARWGIGPLFGAEADRAAARSLVAGGTQRRIADVARSTVTQAATADRYARGWQRMGGGDCAFCAMLVARGAVYTEATARFASHDHCDCVAVPAFSGQPLPVEPYTPSKRRVSDADRARVREYLRTH